MEKEFACNCRLRLVDVRHVLLLVDFRHRRGQSRNVADGDGDCEKGGEKEEKRASATRAGIRTSTMLGVEEKRLKTDGGEGQEDK